MLLRQLVQRKKYPVAHLVFIAIWLIYFGATFSQPYIGINLEQNKDEWVVVKVDPQGQGHKLGIQAGDTIVRVDQVKPEEYPAVKKWGEVEGTGQLEILTSTETARIVEVPPLPFMQNLFYEAPFAFLSLAFWLTGLITLIKRPYLTQVQALYWFSWVVAMAIALASASSRQILWGRELEYIFFSLVPVMLLKLITVFPLERRTKILTWLTHVFILVPIVTAILLGTIIKISVFLLLTVIVAVIIVVYHLIKLLIILPNNSLEKNQVALVLNGLIIGLFPFIILSAGPIIIFGEPILNPRFSVLFILAIPLSFSYVIINNYLPDGKKILLEVSTFLIAAIIAGVALTGMMFLTGQISDHQFTKIIFSQALVAIMVFAGSKVGLSYLFSKSEFTDTKGNQTKTEESHSLQVLKVINRALFLNLEEEKKKITREIHDGPLQLGVELSRRLKDDFEHNKNENLKELSGLADELNYQLRSVCAELRPATLSDLGLIPAVELLCQQLMEKNYIDIFLSLNNISREQRFSEEIEVAAYRFFQEGLNNVVKHSGCQKAKIKISLADDRLDLFVQDHGKGFAIEQVEDWMLQGKHLGIIGMKERIIRLNGDVKIKTRPGKGVSLAASIPVELN